MTAILATIALLFGAILGLRFKVFVLVPATIFCAAATVVTDIAHNDDSWSILISLILVMTALQVGYVAVTLAGTRIRKNSPETAMVAQRLTQ